MSDFTGFPQGFIDFFADLEGNNDKAWFQANRKRYDDHVVATSRAFVPAFGERLRELVPGIRYEPKANRSLGRINRDIRFSKDKSPYNLHMAYRFWEGEGKVTANPHFTVWVGHQGVAVGAGVRGIPKERLDEFRHRLVDPVSGGALTELMGRLEDEEDYRFIGEKYKRVPAGYPADHPNARWLRFVGLACYVWTELPVEIGTVGILDVLAEHCERMAPLHRWIVDWF